MKGHSIHTANSGSTGGGGGGTSDATAANQVIGNNSLSSIDGKLPATLGSKTSAQSLSVVLASDQGAITANLGATTVVSTNNSSTTPLGISGVFTGTAEDISQFAEIRVSVFSDVASATDGLNIQLSSDGTNWDINNQYTVPATTGKEFGVGSGPRFFRIVYTNSGTAQTTFRLQTTLHKVITKPSSVRPQDNRPNDNDMEEGLSYNMSYDPINNVWSRMQTQDLAITGQGAQTAVSQNIILATAGTGSTDFIGYRSVAIQITPTGTVSSGAVTFEGSNDNTTFVPVLLYDDASSTANPVSTYNPLTGTSRFFSGPVHFRYFRARISTIIGGGGSLQAFTILRQTAFQPDIYTITQATAANLNVTATVASTTLTSVVPGVAATSLGKAEDAVAATGDTGVFVLGVRRDTQTVSASATGDYNEMAVDQYGNTMMRKYATQRRTYSVGFQVTPAATATDVVEIIGSATTNVQITKIFVGGTATQTGSAVVNLIRRSTAASAGTSTNQTIVPHEATDAVATAVIKAYTVNPTTGTLVGQIRSSRIGFGSSTAPTTQYEFSFGENGKPVILAGVAQTLCINLGGVTITGGIMDISIEFTEI